MGKTIVQSRLCQHSQCLRSIVEFSLIVKIKSIFTKVAMNDFDVTFLINQDVFGSECIMKNVLLTEIRHGEYATAEDGHELLCCEVSPYFCSFCDLCEEGVRKIGIVFDHFELFST